MTHDLADKITEAIDKITGPVHQEYSEANIQYAANYRRKENARKAMDKEGQELIKLVRRGLRPYLKNSYYDIFAEPGYVIDHSKKPENRKAFVSVNVVGRGVTIKYSFWPKKAADIIKAGKRIGAALEALSSEQTVTVTGKRIK